MSRAETEISRRTLFRSSSLAAVSGAVGAVIGACSRAPRASAGETTIPLPRLLASSERESKEVETPVPPEQRVGFAVVGLGRLALEQILPAFAETKWARLAALVSGHRSKAEQIADRYGVARKSIYDYEGFDHLSDNPQISVVYIVLPNGMHAEYSIRALKAGKHVLCEKPMANTVNECEQMIQAAKTANKRLMIAYRLQYEPHHRELIRMARSGELGKLKALISANGQNQGDPNQWRLNRALAGGGPLPDVGIYCLNAARYLTGEEPIAVTATTYASPADPRFKEVEEQADFSLQFPSGFIASASSSYGYHNAKYLRLLGERGWAEMDPAFPYQGLRLRTSMKPDGGNTEQVAEHKLETKNHFALEMDHMARCALSNREPHTPGEEGLQDLRIITAAYQAAKERRTIELPKIEGRDRFRGPTPS
jgi:predicted dehydrogenase